MRKVYEEGNGVGFLGIENIPSKWEVKKLKFLANIIDGDRGSEYPNDKDLVEEGKLFLSGDNLKNHELVFTKVRFVTEEKFLKLGRGKLKKNDVIVTVRGTIGNTGLFLADEYPTAFINAQMMIIRTLDRLNSRFFFYYTKTKAWKNILNYFAYGTAQKQLSNKILGELPIISPSNKVQTLIINYLDIKIFDLNSLISEKKKLVKLLEEKRQAMITEAVTKGLNPNVKMKDSGVEWIDEIPEHWTHGKVSYFSMIKTGGTPDKNNDAYWNDGNINWMSSGEVNKEFIKEVNNKITVEGFNNSNATMLPINTVMMALNGQGKTKGKVAVLEIGTTCNQSLAGFITIESNLHYLYLYYFFKSKYKEIRGLVGDGLRDGLTVSLIKSLQIPLPTKEEQVNIAKVLYQYDIEIDELIKRIQNSIEKLNEYRQSLIYEAVTGKIDVRDFDLKQ